MFPIYIPSYNRPNCSTGQLLQKYNIPFTLVVHPLEADSYKENFPDADIISSLSQGTTIGKVRQDILNFCSFKKNRWIWMLDDDLVKFKIFDNDHFKDVNIKIWLQLIEHYIYDKKVHKHKVYQVGASSTMFGFKKNREELYNTNIGCINLLFINKCGRFDTNMVALEDTDFSVNLIKKGYKNLKLCHFIFFSQPSGNKNKSGGLAKVYSNGGKLKGIEQFKLKHPEIIKDYGNGKYRINWKKL